MLRTLLMAGGLVVALALMAGTAKADPVTLTQGPFTATLNVVGNTATLTISAVSGYYTDQVAVHVANGATVVSGTASSGSWTFQNGLNSVNCGGSGNWFCANATSNVNFGSNDLTLSWTFSGGTTIDPVSVQFAICDSSSPSCAPGSLNFVTNFSQSGTVPEPATLSMLGVGLISLLGFGRRFFV